MVVGAVIWIGERGELVVWGRKEGRKGAREEGLGRAYRLTAAEPRSRPQTSACGCLAACSRTCVGVVGVRGQGKTRREEEMMREEDDVAWNRAPTLERMNHFTLRAGSSRSSTIAGSWRCVVCCGCGCVGGRM